MGKKYCVYVHTNKVNGKRYVGITCQRPEDRWKNGSPYRRCPYFYKAIRKYGWNGFMHDVLFNGLTRDDAVEWERLLIKEWKCAEHDYGYNIALGGEGQEMYSLSMRKKMSESALKRNQDPTKFANICEGNRKRWADAAEHDKISKGLKSYYAKNPDRHERISEERKHYFAEHPEKKKTRAVVQLSKAGEVIKVWSNMTEAAQQFGTNSQNISAVCNGRRRTAGGYIWRYSDELQDKAI